MSNKEVIVSILMPAYNSAAFVEESIKSVLRQSHKEWELLIIDDGSTDQTPEIIAQWSRNDSRIRPIYHNVNKGSAAARNAAIEIASGRYIAFLDSDDLWHEQKLAIQLQFMRSTGAPLTYTAYKQIDEEGRVISELINAPAKTSYHQMLNNSVIGCLTAIYDSQQLGKVKMPDVFHADYATWLKILRGGHQAAGLQEPLAFYRIRHGSINRNKIKAAWQRWRVFRDCEQLSIPKSLRYFFVYAYHGILS